MRIVLLTSFCFLFCLINDLSIAQAPTITLNSSISIGGSSSLNGVAYGNGKYITAGVSGRVYISSDGATWALVSHAGIPAVTFYGVAFGNGVFVIIGTTGEISTSTDGLSWTPRTSGLSTLNKVYYIGGLFYATSYSAKAVITSADGITWSGLNFGNTNFNPMNMTYGNGIYAISARDNGSYSYVFTSSSGAAGTWSLTTITNSLATSTNGIFYLKDKFYAFHSGTEVFTSTNGTSWANVTNSIVVTHPNSTTSTIGTPNQIFNGIYDGTSIYLFGNSTYHGSYGIFQSTTGTNFTLQPKSTTIITQGSAYVNGKYFIVGNEGIVGSSDGSAWVYPGGSFQSIATNGSNYVAVGSTGSSEGVIFSSSNFTSWNNRTTTYYNALNGVIYGGSKYVAVGNGGAVVTSADGITWSIGSSGDADQLRSVAYGNSKYVAVGNQGKIMYSSNGTSWTQAKKDGSTGSNFTYVAYINNRFIAVGGAVTVTTGTARVEYSADGITWTVASPSPTIVGQFHSIAYDGTRYILVGRDNTSGVQKFFSRSTTDITNAAGYAAAVTIAASNTGGIELGTASFGGVTFSNGRFVAIANQKSTPFNAYILKSVDGSSWTAYDAGTTSRLRGVIASGDQFRIVGLSDMKMLSSFGAALPLTLVNFTATPLNKTANLQWNTANEQNTSSFEIERSADGLQFSRIGSVAANGSGAHHYEFTDNNIDQVKLYYRLKMTDLDDAYTYSNVRPITFDSDMVTGIQLFPNPAMYSFQLSLPSDAGKGTMTIYNTSGHLVMQKGWVEGQEVVISHLPAGKYEVVLMRGRKKYNVSFVKK